MYFNGVGRGLMDAVANSAVEWPKLSIVIPCFNEEGCLPELYVRVCNVARGEVGDDFELVLVNDGSTDKSWSIIVGLSQADPHVVGVNLSRNHGHQLALTAGLDLCRGQEILILDADLQDPPELLAQMRAAMRDQEADVVYAVRRQRDGETALKKATAALFYRLLDRLTDTQIPMDTGDFRLMSRRALDAFLQMPEQARFVRGMVSWIGFRQVPVVYDRQQRFAGETKYPMIKMLKLAFDAITGFSTLPLRLASHVGLALTVCSLLMMLFILTSWALGYAIAGWTSTALLIVAIGAVQMFALGLIGEYVGRIYTEVKRRPLYLVADVVGQARLYANLGYVNQTQFQFGPNPRIIDDDA